MKKRNITPEYLMEYFKKNKEDVSPDDAIKFLDHLYFLAELIVKNNALFIQDKSDQITLVRLL